MKKLIKRIKKAYYLYILSKKFYSLSRHEQETVRKVCEDYIVYANKALEYSEISTRHNSNVYNKLVEKHMHLGLCAYFCNKLNPIIYRKLFEINRLKKYNLIMELFTPENKGYISPVLFDATLHWNDGFVESHDPKKCFPERMEVIRDLLNQIIYPIVGKQKL